MILTRPPAEECRVAVRGAGFRVLGLFWVLGSRFGVQGECDVCFAAYATDPQARGAKPIGIAFWTPDITPELLGYHGHIHMLIGMNMTGTLTGVIVDWNTEPYGDFSVEPLAFGAQFTGKSIRDAFAVGKDVDIVSRATITVRAAAQIIRESSRTVARALLTPGAVKD